MPKAEFPTSLKGWLVAMGAGVIGWFAGFGFIAFCQRYA